MTNWKAFRIDSVETWYQHNCVRIVLNGTVDFWDSSNKDRIFCVNRYPFNAWEKGDIIEIDLDELKYWDNMDDINSVSMVRRATTTGALVAVSSSIEVQQALRRAQLSGEKFEYRIEKTDPWTGDYRCETVAYDPRR